MISFWYQSRGLRTARFRPSVLLEHGTFVLRVLHGGRVGGKSPARIELTAAQQSTFGAEFAPNADLTVNTVRLLRERPLVLAG